MVASPHSSLPKHSLDKPLGSLLWRTWEKNLLGRVITKGPAACVCQITKGCSMLLYQNRQGLGVLGSTICALARLGEAPERPRPLSQLTFILY